jgi:hypothetical protein
MLKLMALILLAAPMSAQAATVTYQLSDVGRILIDRDALVYGSESWHLVPNGVAPDNWRTDNWHQIEIHMPGYAEAEYAFFDIEVDANLVPTDWLLNFVFGTIGGVGYTRYSPEGGYTLTMVAPIPLPPAAAMLGAGVLVLIGARRFRRSRYNSTSAA